MSNGQDQFELMTKTIRRLEGDVIILRDACKRLAQDRYNEVRLALEDVKLAQVVAVGFPHEPWCQAFEEKEDLPCNCQRKKLLDVLKSARTNLEPLTVRPAPEGAK